MRSLTLLLGIVLLSWLPAAGAAVIHVPGDQPTIQAGIDAASAGDTVLVADGTYTGPGNRDLDFHGKSITVTSENGPEVCIINCQEQGRGFHFHSGEDESAVVHGISIGNGYISGGGGGGILIENWSAPVISNCVINGCNAGYGGGVAASGGLIRDCFIRLNGANTGAGLSLSGSAAAHNCLVWGNLATEMGGGLYASSEGHPTVSNCTFTVNNSFEDGGGLFIYNLTMTNCIVWNNSAGLSGPDGYVGSYGDNTFSYSYSETGLYWYVEGSWVLDPGPGNITADPRFSSGPGGDWYLSQTAAGQSLNSPCYDTADPAAPLFGTTRTDQVPDSVVLDMGYHYLVAPGPEICHDPAYFTYDHQSGSSPPADRTLSIWNCAEETLEWSVSSSAGWLTLAPLSGSSTGEGDPVTVSIDPSSLSAGTKRAEIVISAPGAWNSPVTIPVTLVVDGPFPYWGLVAGPGPSPDNPPLVRVFDRWVSPVLRHEFLAYGAAGYGVRVSCGDPDGDGVDEIITGAGPGAIYGPHVRGFEPDGTPLPGLSFMAYGTNKWGVNISCGDLDGDGTDEIVTGAGPGSVFGPHVRAFSYDPGTGSVTPLGGVSYFAYGTERWGVNVDCGDLDGDGMDEIVTGAGPGAVFGPHVRGWNVDGSSVSPMPGVSFLSYNSNHFGVNVACGDLDGDGRDEIVTAPGPGPELSAHIRGWNVDSGQVTSIPGCEVSAWPPIRRRYGARVAVVPGGGPVETVLVGGGPAPAAESDIQAYLFNTGTGQLEFQFSFHAFDSMLHGVAVAGGGLE